MEKSLTRRIIVLLVHWAVLFMPSFIVECLFSNFHTLCTRRLLFYVKDFVLIHVAIHTLTLMAWVTLMQSIPSHLCPESVWCSPHPHTYVLSPHPHIYALSQSDVVHTLTLMSWITLMQSTPTHLCPESLWCSPHPHTYVLSQSDAVHTLTLMSWASLM